MQLAYKWQAASVVALGLFMAVLDNTIVSVALPQMQKAFHVADYSSIIWVSTAYFLAQAAVIPITGYLSDRLGSKTVFLTALALFTLGSGLCAFAATREALIFFRVLQGIGGGALFPTAFAITFRIFPPAERGQASALIGVPVLLAPAFGPTIGGFLTTNFNWNAIFIVNLPLGILTFVMGYLILQGRDEEARESGLTAKERKGFDVIGLVLSMAGFTSLVYGISTAGTAHDGWRDATVDRYLIAGAVLLIAYVVLALRASDPVMDVRLFKNYTFTVANILIWAVSAFLFGSLFLLPYFFENVRGYSALSTGEIFIVQGLAAAVGVVISGGLYNRFGPRVFAVGGLVLITVATYGLTQLSVDTTGASITGFLLIRGLGLGMTNTPLQTVSLATVTNRDMARASSLVNVTRQVFSAMGVAILSTYLAQQGKNHASDLAVTFQNTQLASVQRACAVQFGAQGPNAIKGCIQQAAGTYVKNHSITMGLNDTFVVVMIGCAIAAVLAIFLGRDPTLAKGAQAQPSAERRPALMAE